MRNSEIGANNECEVQLETNSKAPESTGPDRLNESSSLPVRAATNVNRDMETPSRGCGNGIDGSTICLALTIAVLFMALGYISGKHHFVNTRAGVKVYEKSSFTFDDTFVDMTEMSILELPAHMGVVMAMANDGDIEYVPGGESLIVIGKAGKRVVDVLRRFNDEYQLSDSVAKIERIGEEQYEILNEKYDISAKSEKAQKAVRAGAKRIGEWWKAQ